MFFAYESIEQRYGDESIEQRYRDGVKKDLPSIVVPSMRSSTRVCTLDCLLLFTKFF